ncbi:hypothetical protein F511_47315 [Dorcoceras hygrometricum]|uniref:Uncharacterized protein n=1 Tax=Dorcoceras hygrometricum TaxID=472368 RepID=A0A2Z6ZYK5_9LAMI|nr:hypothetical protein F511_47315 [Dorcoceras hygrometricum]
MLRVDGRTLGAAACEEIGHWIARDCATGCRKAAPLHARCVRDCCTAQCNRCAVVRCWPADVVTAGPNSFRVWFGPVPGSP